MTERRVRCDVRTCERVLRWDLSDEERRNLRKRPAWGKIAVRCLYCRRVFCPQHARKHFAPTPARAIQTSLGRMLNRARAEVVRLRKKLKATER